MLSWARQINTTLTRSVSFEVIASSPFETWLLPSPVLFVDFADFAFAAVAGQWTAEDVPCAANTKNLDVLCISTPIHTICCLHPPECKMHCADCSIV